MRQAEFEDLVSKAGLNLLSRWAPRFIVSLYVPREFGMRRQTAVISFASVEALEAATADECKSAIDETKTRLSRAAQTKQGDIAQGGEVRVRVEQEEVAPVGINYPAH
jgi:hypothetical protein